MKPHRNVIILAIGVVSVGLLGSGFLLGYQAHTQEDTSFTQEETKILYDMHTTDRVYKEAKVTNFIMYWVYDYILAGMEFGYRYPIAGKYLGGLYTFISLSFLSQIIVETGRNITKPPKPKPPKT